MRLANRCPQADAFGGTEPTKTTLRVGSNRPSPPPTRKADWKVEKSYKTKSAAHFFCESKKLPGQHLQPELPPFSRIAAIVGTSRDGRDRLLVHRPRHTCTPFSSKQRCATRKRICEFVQTCGFRLPGALLRRIQSKDVLSIDEQILKYSVSLSSSVLDYPVEYGRRYHAFRSGTYIMPNDEPEMDRMDMCHSMMTRAIGNRLFLAPLERSRIHAVLDVGTGTGIWAIEMGDLFENAEIIGIDLSAIQPTWQVYKKS
ncbi:methyltransferase [Colletotrichum simmondsii]|uniref:Methyltransferase n=1 Tax=Colletotrichum simmondsii TaxID=703756 RepID=A0A135SEV1_9PEZI|nr:methyltransferase [Colletotrichum simmondsii]